MAAPALGTATTATPATAAALVAAAAGSSGTTHADGRSRALLVTFGLATTAALSIGGIAWARRHLRRKEATSKQEEDNTEPVPAEEAEEATEAEQPRPPSWCDLVDQEEALVVSVA
jgi:hypothetical protein